jgi:rifampin ADP-ribosylating transferase
MLSTGWRQWAPTTRRSTRSQTLLPPKLQIVGPSEKSVDDASRTDATKSIAEAIAESSDADYVPVTFERCDHILGPFFHGTKVAFDVGDEIVPGQGSNFHEGRISNHVYFAALLEPAVWGAELAVALGGGGRERVYLVEPTGPFEDDPNVTNKKFPGNVTQSYRTRDPMRVTGELETWEPHPPEVVQGMLDSIARLRAQGLDVVED